LGENTIALYAPKPFSDDAITRCRYPERQALWANSRARGRSNAVKNVILDAA
jgi:hypothetical protein